MAKNSLNDCGTKLCRAREDILDGDANDTLSEVERDALFASVQVINLSVPPCPFFSYPLLHEFSAFFRA